MGVKGKDFTYFVKIRVINPLALPLEMFPIHEKNFENCVHMKTMFTCVYEAVLGLMRMIFQNI